MNGVPHGGRAAAKLNLTLEVVGRRPDGFHDIRSVFVLVPQLADTIVVTVEPAGHGIELTSDSADVPLDHTNTCHRAAALFLATTGEDARIRVHIEKRIPMAAGLGGGSSDAAGVLLALNRHYAGSLSDAALKDLGGAIGKDVPFFLSGATAAFVAGTGEVIEPVEGTPRLRYLIVNPGIPASTAWAYKALDQCLWFMATSEREDISRAMLSALKEGDLSAVAARLYNDFEVLLEREQPVIKELKQALIAFGAAGALMSGTGSTVFGVFADEQRLVRARGMLRARYPAFLIA